MQTYFDVASGRSVSAAEALGPKGQVRPGYGCRVAHQFMDGQATATPLGDAMLADAAALAATTEAFSDSSPEAANARRAHATSVSRIGARS